MPKSCSNWGRAGVGLETSNTFSCTLRDPGLMWASQAPSLFLPPVRSVRSSHRQLTSQFHLLTPAARRSRGLEWLPYHPLPQKTPLGSLTPGGGEVRSLSCGIIGILMIISISIAQWLLSTLSWALWISYFIPKLPSLTLWPHFTGE